MTQWRAFLSRTEAGSAAEFAMILPLAMLFFFGIIDTGRYMWNVNEAEKATQKGARFAVATDMVASDLANYSFAISGGITQGAIVPKTSFQSIACGSDGTTVTCSCPASAPCSFGTTADAAAFRRIVARMQMSLGSIMEQNVVINYEWSGLGFSGDPNGPDVAPVVNVSLKGLTMAPILATPFGGAISLPAASYSLTMEDGQGTVSN